MPDDEIDNSANRARVGKEGVQRIKKTQINAGKILIKHSRRKCKNGFISFRIRFLAGVAFVICPFGCRRTNLTPRARTKLCGVGAPAMNDTGSLQWQRIDGKWPISAETQSNDGAGRALQRHTSQCSKSTKLNRQLELRHCDVTAGQEWRVIQNNCCTTVPERVGLRPASSHGSGDRDSR